METFFILIWFGGIVPTYRHARNNGLNVFASLLNVLIWPVEVGWHLADMCCEDHKK